jgi:HD-GYP domain-containing protein (c-di-GMP phosphodiesterase class II)
LTTARPYKTAGTHVEAREWIASRCATHFDPLVVEAFVACEEEFLQIQQSYSGQLAEFCAVIPEAYVATPAADSVEPIEL